MKINPSSPQEILEQASALLDGGADDDWLMDEEGGEDPDADKGPWVDATFESECACGYHTIFPGDLIRADGSGEWELEECST